MEFSVFGEIEVRKDGTLVDLGGPKQQMLVAFLLTKPGRTVGVDELLDALWDGESPPKHPSRAVQTYVSRLRGILGADRVLAQRSGYSLAVHQGELDVELYKEVAEAGRRLKSSGDLVGALRTFEESEERWSGQPWGLYSAHYWAIPDVQRLEELRASVGEQRAESLLQLGDPAKALEEALLLRNLHPLREGPVRTEMLALFRLGRTAEASRSFQAYCADLAEETGLSPSAELTRTEEQILRQDPDLLQGGPTVRGFELLRRLSESDGVTTWSARQTGLDREVSLTVIGSEHADDPDFIRRFETTVRLMSGIDNRGVVPLLDAWRDHRGAFVVTQLASTTAAESPDGGWAAATVRRLLIEVSGGLAALHAAGVAHGPVDLSQIVLDEGEGAALSGSGLLACTGDQKADDLRSLGAAGADILAQSTDVDTALASLLREVASGESDVSSAEQLVSALQGSSGIFEGGPGLSGLKAATRNPFKGLRAFDLADADDFFGRKDVVAELVDRTMTDRLVVVIGASGSGKSSVVRAGVHPALIQQAELGGRPWFGVTMVPGADPFEALEAALLRIAVNPPATLREQLLADDRGIMRAVDRALPDDRSDLVLVLDQLEELWTVTDAEPRDAFVGALVQALTSPHSRLKVIATLRADLFDRPLADPAFGELLADASVPLPALSSGQLEEIVAGPARRAGLEFEPAVVAELVRAGLSEPSALPLIQFALTELVENRSSDVITIDDLDRLGGIPGAIARRAEDVFQTLGPEAQVASRGLFGRLVSLTSGEPTRRRANRTELGNRAAEEAVSAFGEARLLAFDRDGETRTPTVEVGHEALLTAWPRLRDWIVEDADDLRTVGRLLTASTSWHQSGYESGELLRGAPLAAAASLAAENPDRLTENEHRFVAASEEQLLQEQQHEQRRNHRLQFALSTVAVLLAISMVAGLIALGQRNEARNSAFAAETSRLAASVGSYTGSDPSMALLIAAESYRRQPSPETLGSVQRALLGSGSVLGVRAAERDVVAVRWLDDDRLAAITKTEITVIAAVSGETLTSIPVELPVKDVSDPTRRTPVALHRETGQLAVPSQGGAVTVVTINADSTAATRSYSVESTVRALAISPDGEHLYIGDADGMIHGIDRDGSRSSWAAHRPSDYLPEGFDYGNAGETLYRAYKRQGVVGLLATEDKLVSAGGAQISIWNRADGSLLSEGFGGPFVDEGIRRLAIPRWFSLDPDDETTVIVQATGIGFSPVGTVSLESGTQEWFELETLGRDVVSLDIEHAAFANGSAYVLMSDGLVRAADPETGAMTQVAIPSSLRQAQALDVSADGRTAAVATTGGVTLLALDGRTLLSETIPLGSETGSLEVSIGGDVVSTTSFEAGKTQVYDRTASGFRRREIPAERGLGLIGLPAPEGPFQSAAQEWSFTAEGHLQMRAIDRSTLEPLGEWIKDAPGSVFSADRSMLYFVPLGESYTLAFGDYRIRSSTWPGGVPGQAIDFTTGRVGGVPQVLSVDERLLIGIYLSEPGPTWALDLDAGVAVESPLDVDYGIARIRRSIDGEYLLLFRTDGLVEERDAATYELLRIVASSEPPAVDEHLPLAVNPDRSRLLTMTNKQPRLFDTEAGEQIGEHFPHDQTSVLIGGADAATDGPLQLITAVGEHAHVWNLETDRWVEIACLAAGRNLTADEWQRLGPRDDSPRATCEQWPNPAQVN